MNDQHKRDHKTIADRYVLRKPFKINGIWHGRVRDIKTGKVVTRSTGVKDKRKAEQILQKWVETLGDERGGKKVTSPLFEKAFKEWIDLKDLRPSTLRDYSAAFTGVYLPAFKDHLVDDISSKDIENFLKNIRNKRKASARTQQKHLTYLRSFFNWCLRHKYCNDNPTTGIKAPRAAKRKGIALTHEQACNLIKACRIPVVKKVKDYRRGEWKQTFTPPDHLFLAVLTALHTGLRRGNIVGLKWSQVDFKHKKITIPAEEMKANADHEIPIHPELFSVLKKELRKQDKIDPDQNVLGINLASITSSFQSSLKRAELPHIRWHDLRHTFATWISVRCSYAALRQLLGHSPGSVTLQYTHVSFEDLRKTIEELPSLLLDAGNHTNFDIKSEMS